MNSESKPAAQVQQEDLDEPMRLVVALDFADNPRPYHSLMCPADTNGELYRALRTIAAAYRATHPAGDALGAVEVTAEMVQAAYSRCDNFIDEHAAGDVSDLDDGQWNDMLRIAITAAIQHRGDSRGGEG